MSDQLLEAGIPVSASDLPGFAFADLERRTFIKLARDGSYYHLVHPVDVEDRRVQDHLTTPGMLVCDGCKGGRYRGTCHAVTSAEQALRGAGKSASPDWIGPGPTSSGYPDDSPNWPAPMDTPLGLEDDLAGAEAEA